MTDKLGSKPKLVDDKRVNRADIENLAYRLYRDDYPNTVMDKWDHETLELRNKYRKIAADLLNENYLDG